MIKRPLIIIITVNLCCFAFPLYGEQNGLDMMLEQMTDAIKNSYPSERHSPKQNRLDKMFKQITDAIKNSYSTVNCPPKKVISGEKNKGVTILNSNHVLWVNREFGFFIIRDLNKKLNKGKEVVIMRKGRLIAIGRVSSITNDSYAVVNIILEKNNIKTTDLWEI